MQPAANGDPTYASKNVRINKNVFAWHDEEFNKKPLWVTPTTKLYGNRYCGTPTAYGSLNFWLQDWAPNPGNVFNWNGWQSAKVSGSYTAPAYDTPTTVNGVTYTSVMQLAAMPAQVQAWQTTPDKTLTLPNGVSTTRTAIQAIVDQYCK